MANPGDFSGIVKKELHVFYILDTSGSMSGAPIAALNDAMKDTVAELTDISANSADAALKIAVMAYSTTARWVTMGNNGLEDAEDFVWTDLHAGGMTHLGAALAELNRRLSRDEMMKSVTGNKTPVIIFMSDGYPNDSWLPELDRLKENRWYDAAIKIAFALGDQADCDVLAKVVGTPEAVIQTNDLDVFKAMIRIVSVSSSLAASGSVITGAGPDGRSIVDALGGRSRGGSVTITDLPDDPYVSIYPGDSPDDSIFGAAGDWS